MDIKLGELGERFGGSIHGDPGVRLTGFAGLNRAGPGDITFLRPSGTADELARTRASAVVVPESVTHPGLNLLQVSEPESVFNCIARELGPKPPDVAPGIHPTAAVDPAATIDPSAAIGPYVVVERGATIGPRTQVGAFGYVGHGVRIGADCRFFPRVVLREDTWVGDRVVLDCGVVVGADGFGWEPGPDGPRRIPQLGRVVLEDGVELGANTTVDRARLDETRIGHGSKLDNLVHIGHNVELGAYNMFAAQVGLAGTVKVGKGVEMGGQVGVRGHITIGDGARIGAQSGVMFSVEPGKSMFGSPAVSAQLRKRVVLLEPELPGLFKRVRILEQKVARFEEPADP